MIKKVFSEMIDNSMNVSKPYGTFEIFIGFLALSIKS